MDSVNFSELASKHLEKVYYNLETLCICFPGRIAGSENLEKALDFFETCGAENFPEGVCKSEVVQCVPCWVRGDWKEETCEFEIIPGENVKPEPYPLMRQMRVLANGLSVGTPKEGVSGPLVIVNSWEQPKLAGEAGSLKDAIVLYDYKNFIDYDQHAGLSTTFFFPNLRH